MTLHRDNFNLSFPFFTFSQLSLSLLSSEFAAFSSFSHDLLLSYHHTSISLSLSLSLPFFGNTLPEDEEEEL
jgi:hypothetical protein